MEEYNEQEEEDEDWNGDDNHDDENSYGVDDYDEYFDDVNDYDEYYDGVDDYGHVYSEEVRHQIETNDPNLTKLNIGDDYNAHDNGWERDGNSVGRNTQLKELEFCSDHPIEKEHMEKFFRGVAANRSIEKLTFCRADFGDGEIFSILIPFFKQNKNFETMMLDECDLGPTCIHSLATSLAEFNSLKYFSLRCDCFDEDVGTNELIQSLNTGHSDLKKLELCNIPLACDELAALLKNPKSKLALLALEGNDNLDDEETDILSEGLSKNGTLRELNIREQHEISEKSWQNIFIALQSPSCSRLEKLSLETGIRNDAAALTLSNLLTNSKSLKTLDLSYNLHVSNAGWETIFGFLQSPDCVLEELCMTGNFFNDIVMSCLSNSLFNNGSLRNLSLRDNGAPTNTRENITVVGWQAFSAVLQNSPNSALEKLDLHGNFINDGTMITLANSLANNSKLKEMVIDVNQEWINITHVGWAALSSLLCNKSSIMAIRIIPITHSRNFVKKGQKMNILKTSYLFCV